MTEDEMKEQISLLERAVSEKQKLIERMEVWFKANGIPLETAFLPSHDIGSGAAQIAETAALQPEHAETTALLRPSLRRCSPYE
jgi:hypothetical protein